VRKTPLPGVRSLSSQTSVQPPSLTRALARADSLNSTPGSLCPCPRVASRDRVGDDTLATRQPGWRIGRRSESSRCPRSWRPGRHRLGQGPGAPWRSLVLLVQWGQRLRDCRDPIKGALTCSTHRRGLRWNGHTDDSSQSRRTTVFPAGTGADISRGGWPLRTTAGRNPCELRMSGGWIAAYPRETGFQS
jgi:hypothetical protein